MDLFLTHLDLLLLFFGVALLYSSVGFGGGSSYLAILALYSFEFTFLRAISLLCNITVVTNGTLQFYRRGFINLKKSLPLVIASVPMAYLGGMIKLEKKTFFIILGITLFFAAIAVWFRPATDSKTTEENPNQPKNSFISNALIGGGIGFVSGMVGIGGGIFLSPLLYLIRWDAPKQISAMASLFILVNSISGLFGQFSGGIPAFDWQLAAGLLVAVAFGGFLGNYLGIVKFKPILVQRATALLIAYVSIQLLMKYLT